MEQRRLRTRKSTKALASAALQRPGRPRATNRTVKRHTQTTSRGRTPSSWVVFSGTEAEAEASESEKQEQQPEPEPELPPLGDEFIPVMSMAEIPKGSRKQVTVDNKEVLVFWYRKELRAIEAKSTAEAFYSEGFKSAKFTQDYGIVCPTTESVFSIVDGSILDWYPSNPVLRKLTPKETCRPIEIYTVGVRGDVIHVNPEGSLKDWVPESGLRSDFTMPGQLTTGLSKGGSDTSIESNNVYGVEPKMYLEGTNPDDYMDETSVSDVAKNISPATLVAGIVAVGIVAVAGTGGCVFYQNWVALAVFWLIGISIVGYTAQTLTNFGADDSTNKI